MARGRHKRRGYHQNGYKQDGTTLSVNMCPHCIAIACDPMSMSFQFRHKVDERRRKGLCHCCGQPKAHCTCKSSENIAPGVNTIKTHNNKKRRRALAEITAREKLVKLWNDHEDILYDALGDDRYCDTAHCIRYHRIPEKLTWNEFVRVANIVGIDPEIFRLAWIPRTA